MQICYPKRTDKPLYHGLVTQCASLRLPFLDAEEVLQADLDDYAVVIDALFGFSFKGPPRPPFDGLLQKLAAAQRALIAAVDIPSGALASSLQGFKYRVRGIRAHSGGHTCMIPAIWQFFWRTSPDKALQ